MIIGNLGAGLNGYLRLKINQQSLGISQSIYKFPVVNGDVTFAVPPNPADTVYFVDFAIEEDDRFDPTEQWIVPVNATDLNEIRGMTRYTNNYLRQENARIQSEYDTLNANLQEAIAQAIAPLVDEIGVLEASNAGLSSQVELLTQEKTFLITEFTKQVADLTIEKAELARENADLTSDYEEKIAILKGRINLLIQETQALSRQLEIMRSRSRGGNVAVDIARMVRGDK